MATTSTQATQATQSEPQAAAAASTAVRTYFIAEIDLGPFIARVWSRTSNRLDRAEQSTQRQILVKAAGSLAKDAATIAKALSAVPNVYSVEVQDIHTKDSVLVIQGDK